MNNLKLLVSYDGTDYFGWQKTQTGKSIEETLENALRQILREEITLQAASRTDRGVHAEGQVVNFVTQASDLHLVHRGVNAVLPRNISVKSVEIAEPSFHPTLDSKGKEYHYHICPVPVQLPFYRSFSWHVPTPLALEEMKQAAQLLLGTRDFSEFCNEQADSKRSGICTLRSIELEMLSDGRLQIVVIGDNFLYKMVRNLVGTLVYVGMGKIKAENIPDILESRDRTRAGVTAPAQGLLLKRVFY
jgi:tRNA pseudouridine38-40 synthase